MKKTEKIEIRLSHEEKQALGQLAEREGRTISKLVRDLIERYMALNTPVTIMRLSWQKMLGLLAGGIFLGGLGTYAFMETVEKAPLYSVGIHTGGEALNITILANSEAENFILPHPEGDIRMTVKIDQYQSQLAMAEFTFCRVVDDICETIANPSLQLGSNNKANIRFFDNTGVRFSIYTVKENV